MRIPIWTLISDTDAGTEVTTYTNEHEAFTRLYAAAFGDDDAPDPEGRKARVQAQQALAEERYVDLADIISTDCEGSGDYYTVHEDQIETPALFTPGELATWPCPQNAYPI